jgi:hypothetical protein
MRKDVISNDDTAGRHVQHIEKTDVVFLVVPHVAGRVLLLTRIAPAG